MSVSLYLGLPGDGKSMSGVRRLETVMARTQQWGVTNLPMEVGEFSAYLEREHGQDYDCGRRVVLMSQEQVRKFWLIRGDGWRLVDLEDAAWAQNQFPSLQRCYRWLPGEGLEERRPIESMTIREVEALVQAGQVEVGDVGKLGLQASYIIDESQNFWPARSYQSTPKGLLFYLSQHRHVGDDCIFITQKETQVEKVVRNLVMEFWVFRNLGQRKRLGFRLPNVFGYACYNEPPSGVGAEYQAIGTFRMDTKGLAACYRTADGVGVGGPTMVADTATKKHGWSWRWAVGIMFVLLVVAGCLPFLLADGLSWALLGGKKELPGMAAPVLPETNQVSVVGGKSDAVLALEKFTAELEAARRDREERIPVYEAPVFIEAAFKGGDGWWLSLTDGRRLGPGEYYAANEWEGRLVNVELRKGKILEWKAVLPAQTVDRDFQAEKAVMQKRAEAQAQSVKARAGNINRMRAK